MAITSASCETYFSTYPGKYFTGDGCRRDEDGYYWITGRVDDVINVSGHRMGTAEVESALVAHAKVAEAAVVGYPHDIKGQGIYAYVTLMAGEQPSEELRKELVAWVRKEIGADRLARPDPVRAGPAEDALGQDHAPHPAQDRRGRVRQSRRHLDARRPGRGRRPLKNRQNKKATALSTLLVSRIVRGARCARMSGVQAVTVQFISASHTRHRQRGRCIFSNECCLPVIYFDRSFSLLSARPSSRSFRSNALGDRCRASVAGTRGTWQAFCHVI